MLCQTLRIRIFHPVLCMISRFFPVQSCVFHLCCVYLSQEEGVDFSKFDFVVTSDPTKHRLLDLFEVWLISGDEGMMCGSNQMKEVAV